MNPQERMAMQLALMGRRGGSPFGGRPLSPQELILLRRRFPMATGYTQMPAAHRGAHPMATGFTTLPPMR